MQIFVILFSFLYISVLLDGNRFGIVASLSQLITVLSQRDCL